MLQFLIHLTKKILLLGAGINDDVLTGLITRKVPSIEERPGKSNLSDLIVMAEQRNQMAEDSLGALCNEPVVLTGSVYLYFDLRPGCLADEKGGTLPEYTDKYISGDVLELIHGSIQETANWDYIHRLLKLLEAKPNDKAYWAVILQELSNTCHHEYSRAKARFRRHFQAATGRKLFRRQSGMQDKAGNVLVKMNCNLGKLARKDPHLHCLMHLCLQQVSCSEAVDRLKELAATYQKDPSAVGRLVGTDGAALEDFVIVIALIGDINQTLSLPPISRRKGHMFVDRSEQLTAELLKLRSEFDIRDLLAPITGMLKPEVAKNTLQALDQFVADKVGGKMGFLYEDLVQECIGALDCQYQQERARMGKRDEVQNTEWILFPVATDETTKKRIEQRRQKQKTRPAYSSPYDINPATPRAEEPLPESIPLPVFKVSSSTAMVFSTLFDKTQSRGAVHWVDFESALVELGF